MDHYGLVSHGATQTRDALLSVAYTWAFSHLDLSTQHTAPCQDQCAGGAGQEGVAWQHFLPASPPSGFTKPHHSMQWPPRSTLPAVPLLRKGSGRKGYSDRVCPPSLNHVARTGQRRQNNVFLSCQLYAEAQVQRTEEGQLLSQSMDMTE